MGLRRYTGHTACLVWFLYQYLQLTRAHITKSEISMHTWRSPMSAVSQGAFAVIPEISHSDIFYIIKKERDARAQNFMQAKI